jgi:prevent-host-death family protein
MCYMSENQDKPARVGVRELRQNLSVYLDRVKAGETLEVTERGQPVARLGPTLKRPLSIIDRMIASGEITPAARDHRKATMPPPMPDDHTGPTLTEILLEMREEERY